MPYKLVAIQDNVYDYSDGRKAQPKEQLFFSKDEVVSLLESIAWAVDDALPGDDSYYRQSPVIDALRRAISLVEEKEFVI